MTPDPKALAVLLDAARACYGDDSEQVRWLLNPEAVRELLKHTPLEGIHAQGEVCVECGAEDGSAHQVVILEGPRGGRGPKRPRVHCPIAAAWRALGDPRGAADVERAHEEALREQARRIPLPLREMTIYASAPRPDGALQQPAHELIRAIAVINSNTQRDAMARDFEGVHCVLDERLDPEEYRLHRDGHGLGGPVRSILGPAPFAQFGVRAWTDLQRSFSDARGMEAVEDDARQHHGAWQQSRYPIAT